MLMITYFPAARIVKWTRNTGALKQEYWNTLSLTVPVFTREVSEAAHSKSAYTPSGFSNKTQHQDSASN